MPPTTAPVTTSPPTTVEAPTTSPSTTSTTTGPSRCQPSQLGLVLENDGGATGHAEYTAVLTNASGVSCTMYGYPGLGFLDSSGRPIPVAVLRGGSFMFPPAPPAMVDLAPGATASFSFSYGDNPPSGTTCPVATTVEVTPPNDYGHLSVGGLSLHLCSRVETQAVQAGSHPRSFG